MNRKAFTLIELLVVVAIIGILAAVGVVAYNGYTASAKKSACLDQSKTFKKTILTKWINAEIQSGPDVRHLYGGTCYLFWLNTNCGTDITTAINKNCAVPNDCDAYYQGREGQAYNHFWALGFRNPYDKNKPGLVAPGKNNDLIVGSTAFRCGANAGLTDKYQCKLITLCEIGNQTETIISNKQ